MSTVKFSTILNRPWGVALVVIVSSLLLTLAPSRQSLWIDEALIARVAMMSGDLGGWLQMMLHDPDSEFFKPGFTFAASALAHLFGTSEYGFRMGNIVWGVLAVSALAIAGRRLKLWWLPLLFAVHPFVWFYMDELRPYMMQLAAASWMLASLLFLTDSEANARPRILWINVFWLASFCCYSANMLGALCIASCLLALGALYLHRRQWPPREILLWSLPWIVLHALLSLYFLRCMQIVHGAAGAELWPPSAANMGFAAYELLGFVGFGPGRDAIRETVRTEGVHGLISLMQPYAGALLGFSVITLIAWVGVFRSWIKGKNRLWIALFALVAALNVLLMFTGALKAGWPFWGRHLSPALPFLLILSAMGMAAYGRASRILVPVWIACLFLGALHMRFSGGNSKDDYRSASATALASLSHGKNIWWAADPIAANFYHLFPTELHPRKVALWKNTHADSTWPTLPGSRIGDSRVTLIISESAENLAMLPTPDVIILSKRDIYDASGGLQCWIDAHHFKLRDTIPAFTIWERPNDLK